MTAPVWHDGVPAEVLADFPDGPDRAEKAVREDVEDQVHVGWRAARAVLTELARWRAAAATFAAAASVPTPSPTRSALIPQLTVRTLHGRIVAAPFNGGVDDRVDLWWHDDRTPRRMVNGPLRAAGLRALGEHLLRCADVLDQHAPQPIGDPS